MKIRIDFPATYGPVLNRMALEAQVSIDDLAKIALYNIIALWMQERGIVDDSLLPNSSYGAHYVDGEPGDDADPTVPLDEKTPNPR